MQRQLVILAGGKGTRLKDRLGDLPKPLIPIAGKPLLEHQVELARQHGFTEVLMFVHHRADLIQAHFGDGNRWGVKVDYVVEREPLGTAGAVLTGAERLADRFAVMYGDTMVNVDLSRLWEAHTRAGAHATLLLHPNDHPQDSDLVETAADGHITAFHNRPHPQGVWRQNLVNAGLYVLDKRAFESFHDSPAENALSGRAVSNAPGTGDSEPVGHGHHGLDFGKDLFPALLRRGARLMGYHSPEYIKDIGTPQRYDRVRAEYEEGVVQRSSMVTPQRAVFLDRDGTLIEEVSAQGLVRPEQLTLLPGAAEAIGRLNHAGIRAVVVTNQPVVAKGFCTEARLREIHNKLETVLGLDHAFLDRIYWCPHHPEKGFPGERPELKIECECRKPRIGMIRQAVRELNIDLAQSWLIGDSTTDLQTARNAGLRSILVRTGYAGRDGKHAVQPDHVCDTLAEAVRLVCSQPPPPRGRAEPRPGLPTDLGKGSLPS
jgi:histidinol-phosphate phosphatase family protein